MLYFVSATQLGTFRSPEGEYFVEPLHNFKGEHYEEEHTKPHIVYKKSAPKEQASRENSSCDTSGMVCYMYICNLHKVSNVHAHSGHKLT